MVGNLPSGGRTDHHVGVLADAGKRLGVERAVQRWHRLHVVRAVLLVYGAAQRIDAKGESGNQAHGRCY